MWHLFGGLYLGWGIGANDSANIFGTAVSTKVIRWFTAAVIIAVFAFLGSVIQGAPTVVFVKNSLGSIENLSQGFIASFSAAVTIMILTILSIPSSTSQAAAGAIVGLTLAVGKSAPNWTGLLKALICWVTTPIGAALFAGIFFYGYSKFLQKRIKNLALFNRFIKISTIIAGAIAAYSLGANNCGNATGFFYYENSKNFILGNSQILAGLGGIAIAIGTLTYSKKVMMTVGKGITALDPLTSLLVVLAEGFTVWIFAFIGIPVSTSQAVVGAVLGIGIIKGMATVSKKKLIQIFLGWFATPILGGLISYVLNSI